MDDTCPSPTCIKNVNHFDIYIGDTKKYLKGMERILDSTKSTQWTKGCKINSAVAENVKVQFVDDNFYPDDDLFEDNLFDEDFYDYNFDVRKDAKSIFMTMISTMTTDIQPSPTSSP